MSAPTMEICLHEVSMDLDCADCDRAFEGYEKNEVDYYLFRQQLKDVWFRVDRITTDTDKFLLLSLLLKWRDDNSRVVAIIHEDGTYEDVEQRPELRMVDNAEREKP